MVEEVFRDNQLLTSDVDGVCMWSVFNGKDNTTRQEISHVPIWYFLYYVHQVW